MSHRTSFLNLPGTLAVLAARVGLKLGQVVLEWVSTAIKYSVTGNGGAHSLLLWLNSYSDPSPRRYAGNKYLTSMHGYIQKPLIPDDFRTPSRLVVAKVPSVQFSGPVVCGFEISTKPSMT